uniref:Uncharacterized protein n=1 Tax=Candidatus Kentrum sp. SD TaxID=2126332 RepID=A0A450YCU6_9GAMM|nr:MAG: hypothetical protein BECKSD772F_GA0070984_103722 [Candidatus Kentron sp. SD]VFK80099.1 MAG: hypothetical protein BECKSD772D_GA0070982_108422 [Candidatus Kentron sp. SD]
MMRGHPWCGSFDFRTVLSGPRALIGHGSYFFHLESTCRECGTMALDAKMNECESVTGLVLKSIRIAPLRHFQRERIILLW